METAIQPVFLSHLGLRGCEEAWTGLSESITDRQLWCVEEALEVQSKQESGKGLGD